MKIKFDEIKDIALDHLQEAGLTKELVLQWDVRAAHQLINRVQSYVPKALVGKPLSAYIDSKGNWILKTIKNK